MTSRARVRRARKQHYCCGPNIKPGDYYIEHTQLPGGDCEYANAAGRPVRMSECRDCAERYGRGPLIKQREDADKARDREIE